MRLSKFTLDSLGLKGNYLVLINYCEANDRSEFVKFLSKFQFNSLEFTEPSEGFTKKIQKDSSLAFSINDPKTQDPEDLTTLVNTVPNEINFKVFRPPKEIKEARNILKIFFLIFFFSRCFRLIL